MAVPAQEDHPRGLRPTQGLQQPLLLQREVGPCLPAVLRGDLDKYASIGAHIQQFTRRRFDLLQRAQRAAQRGCEVTEESADPGQTLQRVHHIGPIPPLLLQRQGPLLQTLPRPVGEIVGVLQDVPL